MNNNLIYGKNPVYEVLEKNPKRVNKIYIQNGISFDNRLKKIVELAKGNKILIQYTNLQKFTSEFEEKVNFQGVVASVASVDFIDLEDFLAYKKDGFKRTVFFFLILRPCRLRSARTQSCQYRCSQRAQCHRDAKWKLPTDCR